MQGSKHDRESLVPCIIDPDSLRGCLLLGPLFGPPCSAPLRSSTETLRRLASCHHTASIGVPAYLYQPENPTYLPETLRLTTFEPPPRESAAKNRLLGCLALRGVEIDRSIARLTWGKTVGGGSATISSTVTHSLFLYRWLASFCTFLEKSMKFSFFSFIWGFRVASTMRSLATCWNFLFISGLGS